MMISQQAFICLETSWRRLLRRSDEEAELIVPDLPEPAVVDMPEPDIPPSRGRAAAIATELVHETGGKLLPTEPLTAAERRARAAALRGLALSRGRRFDSARAAFSEAARLDPTLDLTRVPTFWKLERAAHEAAIDAYESAGRARDAAVLRARVQSTFRPKPLRPRHGAALTS